MISLILTNTIDDTFSRIRKTTDRAKRKQTAKITETHEDLLSTVFDLYHWPVCASLLEDFEGVELDVGVRHDGGGSSLRAKGDAIVSTVKREGV